MIIGQAIDCYFENQKLELNQLEFLHIHKNSKINSSQFKNGCDNL